MGVRLFTEALSRQDRFLLKVNLNKLAELQDDWHYSSLDASLSRKKIYRDIEECETWESVITTIDKGLERSKRNFSVVTREDIIRLTEIKINFPIRFCKSKPAY